MSTATIREQESTAAKKGAITTLAIVSLAYLLFQFWPARPIGFPEMQEKKFEFTTSFDFTEKGVGGGMMDYGTDWKGSSNVNNFEDPSPTPGDAPKNNTTQAPPPDPNPVKEKPVLASNEENPVKTNPGAIKNQNTDPNSTNTPGGSNHGNTNEVGNWGRPDVHVLNDNGKFIWGPPGYGLGNRKWVSLPDPEYSVNQEAKIQFEFVIAPSGDVINVKRPVSSHGDLVNAGIAAIRKWKFEPVDPDKGNQTVKVTMVFKLQ